MRAIRSCPDLRSLGSEAQLAPAGACCAKLPSFGSGSNSGAATGGFLANAPTRNGYLHKSSKAAVSTVPSSPRLKPCRAALANPPAMPDVLEMEALSSKGFLAAECFLRYEAAAPLAASLSAPDLRFQQAPGPQPLATTAAPAATAGTTPIRTAGIAVPTEALNSLASCLATPVLEEEDVRGSTEEMLRRAAIEARTQLQARYVREAARRPSLAEEEEELASMALNNDRRKRKVQYLLQNLPPGLFGDSDDEEASGTAFRDQDAGTAALTSTFDVLASTGSGDASRKHQLVLQERMGVPEALPEAVKGHELALPCDTLFECSIDEWSIDEGDLPTGDAPDGVLKATDTGPCQLSDQVADKAMPGAVPAVVVNNAVPLPAAFAASLAKMQR